MSLNTSIAFGATRTFQMYISLSLDSLLSFIRDNEAYHPPIVFALAFAETLALLSLFIPATSILIVVGAALGGSGLSFWPVWIAAGLGATIGASVSYFIGRYFKDSVHLAWPFRSYPHLLDNSRAFFNRYGLFAIFAGHFFGPARAFVPVVAGTLAVPHVHFQFANIASAFAWSAVVLGPSQWLGQWLSAS